MRTAAVIFVKATNNEDESDDDKIDSHITKMYLY